MGIRLLANGVLGNTNIKAALERIFASNPPSYFASVEYEISKNNYNIPSVKVELLDYSFCAEAKYDLSACRPLDAEILNSLYECEVTYLKMLDRLDWAEVMDYGQRKSHYLKQVQFWNHFIEVNQISLALFANFPHEMYDYIFYSICQLRGIKTLIFDDINFIPDTLFLVEKIENSSPEIKNYYDSLVKSNSTPVLEKTLRYYEEFHGKAKNITPKLIQDLIQIKKKQSSLSTRISNLLGKIFRLLKMPKKFFDVDVWYRLKHSTQNKEKELFKYYQKNSLNNPDLSVPYVFLALHYQPECSSCPMGGAYVDQELIAFLISKNLPKDYLLYVKEHPLQKKYGRSKELYEKIVALPNARLISLDISSFSLIENAKAVATITGTAGWEAFLKAKPVLKFGSSFYQYAPGVFKIRTEKDCQEALSKITSGLVLEQTEVKRYLEALEKASLDSWVLDFLKEPLTRLTREQAIENLVLGLKKYFI